MRAFECEAQHLVEQGAADLVLDEVVERPTPRGLDAEILIGAVDEHDDRHGAGLALEAQERGQPHAISQGHVQDRGGEFAAADVFDAFRERARFHERVRATTKLFKCTGRGPGAPRVASSTSRIGRSVMVRKRSAFRAL